MDLQKEISALSFDRQRLLELLLESEATGSSRASRIGRRLDAEPAEVSFAQQRLWFLQKLNPSETAYNTPAALRVAGDLRREILQKVFDFLIVRHEALRLVFREKKGRVLQLAQKPFPVEIIEENLTEIRAPDRDLPVERLVVKDIGTPFDLETGPLFRVHLYRLGVAEHILLLNMHHIISDGWSLGVIIDEFAALYRDFTLGKNPSLPELEIQYPDFAVWEKKMVESPAWRAQLDYWKKHLAGRVESLKIASAATNGARRTGSVETVSILLRAGLTAEIKRVCAAEHFTLYTFLLAGFQLLLYRYTGRKNFIIGSPVANRNRAETERLIGCFINPLAIRAKLDGDLSFGDLLKETEKTVLDAFENQEIPFELILDAIRRERNEPHKRLFNVWFVLQNAPLAELELPALKVSNYKLPRLASQFDIAMNVNETGDEIHCAIDYSTEMFDSAFIRRMLEHFRNILSAAASSRETKLREISLEEVSPVVSARTVAPDDEDDFDF